MNLSALCNMQTIIRLSRWSSKWDALINFTWHWKCGRLPYKALQMTSAQPKFNCVNAKFKDDDFYSCFFSTYFLYIYIYAYFRKFNVEFNKLIKTVGNRARFFFFRKMRHPPLQKKYLDIFIFSLIKLLQNTTIDRSVSFVYYNDVIEHHDYTKCA